MKYVEAIYVSEDGDYVRFSPIQVRYALLVGVLTQTTRDVAAGEELQMDYSAFRSSEEKFHSDLLSKICNTGSGMVAPGDGDLLLGYADDPKGETKDEF